MAWYDEFFDEHYLDYWAQVLPPERTAREIAFIIDKLAPPPGAAILDLCCGQGRHAIELAKLGHQVTGLDLTPFLLEAGEKAAEAAGVDVRFVQGDMRRIPFEAEFDAVVNLFTAFGYFDSDEEDQQVLASVERCLKPGGMFLVDQSHMLWAVRDFEPRGRREYDDGTVLCEEREFDARTSRFITHATYIKPDGSRAERRNQIRCYTCSELTGMLGRAGLDVVGVFGDFDGGELVMESRRLILIARKPGSV